ncbi:MAG: hypothetical protein QM758_03435 [Armatimonas sp.]
MNRKKILVSLAALTVMSGIAGVASAKEAYHKTVGIGGTELITLRGPDQASVEQREQTLFTRLNWILADPTLQPTDVRVRLVNKELAIYVKERLLLTVSTQDAAYNQTTREKQAAAWRDRLAQTLPTLKATDRPPGE